MSTNDSGRQEVDAAVLETRDPFGVDADGRTHYWFPVRQLVVVTVDEEIVETKDVANLDTWRKFVAQQTGWDWNRWTQKTIGDLAFAPLRRCA